MPQAASRTFFRFPESPSAQRENAGPTSAKPGWFSTMAGVIPVSLVMKGVTGSFRCETIAGMPNGGVVIGYQFDNAADYEASLAAYNADNGFDPAKASSGCPPTGETGLVGWHSDTYPSLHGQQIECLHEGNADKVSVPTYIWTAPTQLAIFKALASPSMNFQQLDDWWTSCELCARSVGSAAREETWRPTCSTARSGRSTVAPTAC